MLVFIDAHAHLPGRPGAREALLAAMDRSGIGRAIVIPGGTVTPLELSRRIIEGGEHDTDIDNARVLAECRASGGRLAPFFFANPHRGTAEYRDVGRHFRGLKLGPAVHGVPLGDARHHALFDVAAELSHPVYLHCLEREGFQVKDLAELARRRPEVRFILGHAGVGTADFAAIETIAPVANIHLETSGGFSMVVATAIARLGGARVLFGSEYPLQDPRVEVTKLQALDLDTPTRDAVMGGSLLELLGGWQ